MCNELHLDVMTFRDCLRASACHRCKARHRAFRQTFRLGEACCCSKQRCTCCLHHQVPKLISCEHVPLLVRLCMHVVSLMRHDSQGPGASSVQEEQSLQQRSRSQEKNKVAQKRYRERQV